MNFEGDQNFAQPPEELFAKLTNTEFLVSCIPDVQAVARAAPDQSIFTLRPGFSFVRGTLEVMLTLVQAEKPKSAVLNARSKGIGASSEVEATLEITAAGSGSRVHWVAEVMQLGGLLKAVPKGLITGAAQKVIADIWASIAANLGR